MDADCFIVHLKTDDTYINFAKDVETRFETRFSINELGRTWPRRKTIKGNWIMKNEISTKIIKRLDAFRSKIYSYLTKDGLNLD